MKVWIINKSSQFIATIAVTVSLETAILDKNTICFGDLLFKGFHKIFKIKEASIYSDLITFKNYSQEENLNSFFDRGNEYSIEIP